MYMMALQLPTVTKMNPDGVVVYAGPDIRRRWQRPHLDSNGTFTIDEGPEQYVDGRGELRRTTRPMGCSMPEVRPGRMLMVGQLEGRLW